MQTQQKEGLVTRVTGSEVWVEVEGGVVRCQLRGRFRIKKKGFRIAAGDCVRVGLSPRDGEAGTVENVEKRDSYLARYIEREAAERIIVANVEMLFVVATLASPPLRHDFVDRVLVAAEWGHVRSSVVLNKIDLSPQRSLDCLSQSSLIVGLSRGNICFIFNIRLPKLQQANGSPEIRARTQSNARRRPRAFFCTSLDVVPTPSENRWMISLALSKRSRDSKQRSNSDI